MTFDRPNRRESSADTGARYGALSSNRRALRQWIMQRSAMLMLLAVIGSASSASAIVFSGPDYAPLGSASCTTAGNPKLAGGATWNCTQTTSAFSNLYIGVKNNNIPAGTSPQGESMNNNAPTSGESEVWVHSATGANTITYTAQTTVRNLVAGPSSFTTAFLRLTLTFGGTGSMVTDATTIALSSATNGAVHSLWRSTAASFSVVAALEASDAPGGPWTPASVYYGTTMVHGKNTTNGETEQSRTDIAFYYSRCGDGTTDTANGAEQCDDGANNGTLNSCCSSTCQFDPNGDPCTGNGSSECSGADTCNGANVCLNNDVASGTPCTDTNPTSAGDCKDAQCNGSGTCDQNFANEANGTGCADGDFCNGADQCNAGACTTHAGDPCDGPGDADSDCSEVCVDTGYEVGNCDGVDPDGSFCTDGLFCTGTESCTSGSCGNSTGDPCSGPDGDLDCTETCDEGADNCDGADPDGTLCRADTGECDVEETCLSGSCPVDDFEPNGTACGDPSDSDCDNPDTCNGNNFCLDNLEPVLTPCGDPSDTDCTNPDTCDGAGACEDNHEPNSTVCRAASAGQECDAVEFCDGAGNCPADGVLAANTICNPSAGICDIAEECDGVSSDCPPDVFEPATTECRADTGDCDVPENCTGSGPLCPTDDFEPTGTACGSPGDTDCDNPDTCNGNNFCLSNNEPLNFPCTSDGETCTLDVCDGAATCTHNAGNAGTECRAASAGQECDEAEVCDGVNTTCPADGVKPASTICRPDAGECDVEEVCDGVSSDCPTDLFEPDGLPCGDPSDTDCTNPDSCLTGQCNGNHEPTSLQCRAASAGQLCDAAEFCDGAGNCPADSPAPSGTICRPSVDVCDLTDTCDGSSFDCPADGKSTAECRGSAGDCDLAESCDGVNDACPMDLKSTAECRPAANSCDVAESCNGTDDDCPVNGFQPDNTPCPNGQFCDGAETCQTGVCTAGGDPCPEFCDEGSDMCLASSCAVSPLNGCRTAQKGLLLIKNNTDNSKDRLVWKWIKGQTTSQMDFGDPTTTASYGLCIYDGGSNLVGTMDVPPSSSFWSLISDKGYKYFDLNATQDGAFKIKLKGSTQPKSKALVKGRGVGLPDPLTATPLSLPVRVQLVNNDNGICFENVFNTPKLNTETKFKAKTP